MEKNVEFSWIVTIHKEPEEFLKRISACLIEAVSDRDELVVIGDQTEEQNFAFFRHITPNIKIWNFEIPGGPSRSRNMAIRIASGEWLVMLDADDSFTVNRNKLIQDCTNAKQFGDPIIITRAKFLDGKELSNTFKEGHIDSFKKNQLFQEYINSLPGNSPFNHIWGKIYQRNFIVQNKVKFCEEMKTFEDTLFCLQAFGKAESFYNSESLTYVYHNNYKKDALRIVRDRKDFKLLCEKIISLKISSESYFSLVSLFFAKTLLRARQMSLLFFMNAFLKIKLDKDLKIASQNLSLVQNESAKRLLREFKILQGFKFWILGRSKRNK